MTESQKYICVVIDDEKEVRIYDLEEEKIIFNIFFTELNSAICLKGALGDVIDKLNEYEETIKALTEKNNGLVNLIDFYSNNVKVSLESVTDTLQRITDGLKEVELE